MTRTIENVLADYRAIFNGRTRYVGQEPRDDELMVIEIDRLRNALTQIANNGESLWAEFGEPQNCVPEFCRAILAGEQVSLSEVQKRS